MLTVSASAWPWHRQCFLMCPWQSQAEAKPPVSKVETSASPVRDTECCTEMSGIN